MRNAAQALVDRYEGMAPDSLRMAVHYEGGDHDIVYVRDDVTEMYSPEEYEEKVKQLVVEGLSDPPTQEQFRLFGEIEVVIRRFEQAVMLHFPMDEFTGVAVTFDKGLAPSLDTLADLGTEVLYETRKGQ